MTVKLTQAATIIGTLGLVVFIVFLGQHHYLSNPDLLEQSVKNFGIWAPIFFIAIQIIQVIIPIIPGGISSGIGVLVFGPVLGFVYNFIGLMAGSIIAFLLVKKYGRPIILKFVDQKVYNKYIGMLDCGKKFERFFAMALLLPGFPDDVLCMIAGLTKMGIKKFIIINLLAKPVGLIVYSMGLKQILILINCLF